MIPRVYLIKFWNCGNKMRNNFFLRRFVCHEYVLMVYFWRNRLMGRESRTLNVLLFSLVFFSFFSLQYSAAIYNITSSSSLLQGQTLTSPGEIFELGFFSPNNSQKQYVGIWYKNVSPSKVVWVANRDKPVADSLAILKIGNDGNLRLVDGKQATIWSTSITRPSSNISSGFLLDNGVFSLMDSVTGEILWESSDHPSDTVMSDTKGPHVYTSWKSDNDPSPGNFVLAFAPRPPLQFFIWRGSTPYWRSEPWDKSRFIGIPEMDTSINGATVKDSQVPGSLSVSLGRFSNCSQKNLFISSQGYVKFMCWENNYGWYANWEAPRSPCDIYGACGPFGFCKTSKRPLNCLCMRGFVPKSSEEWSKGNWTRGCVRRTTLLCERNSSAIAAQAGKADGFWQMRGVRLPDFSYYVDEVAEGCQRWCQDNCSCTGYSYVNGIGCQVWTRELIDVIEFSYGGQDLFIRLTHDELGKGKPEKFITILIAISTFAVLTAILYALYKWRANQNRRVKHEGIKENDQLELPMLDFDGILVATNHFNLTNKLGQGGYGPVYKGRLQDGKDVAIKRLSSSSGQGVEEFKNEITLISKLQHRNLVKLVGCCVEREEKILVYEFLSNKSLDTHLFDPIKKANLNWTIRYNIINGIGRGLLYLHRDSCLRVIHRDLKVSNILLDEKMNPKISDFGLARIFQGTHGLANTNRVVGTLGYMAPEYALGGIFSDKSDVFSFGILLLEIVSSKKIYDFHCEEKHLGLLSYAWQSWCESRGINMVDEALAESFSQSEVIRCVNIGLLCVQDHAADRPTMAAIVSMLSGEAKLPQPKQPTFTFQSILQSENHCAYSINEVTESVVEGR